MKTINRNDNMNSAKNTALRQMVEKDEADRQFEEWRKSYVLEKRKREYADQEKDDPLFQSNKSKRSFNQWRREYQDNKKRQRYTAGRERPVMYRTTGRLGSPVEMV